MDAKYSSKSHLEQAKGEEARLEQTRLEQARVLRCQSCAAALMSEQASNVMEKAHIECQYCGSHNVFDFAKEDAKEAIKTPQKSSVIKKLLKIRPRHMTIEEGVNSIAIRSKWRNGLLSSLFSILVPILWLIAAMAITTQSFFEKSVETGEKIPLIFFIAIFALIGIHIIYRNMQKLLNVSVVEMANQALTIKHAPLPSYGSAKKRWPQVRQYRRDEISEFVSIAASKTSLHSRIYVIDSHGHRQPLFKKLVTQEEGNFIIERLNKYLLQKQN